MMLQLKMMFSGMFKKNIQILQSTNAIKYANELINSLDIEKCIDIDTEQSKRDPALKTDYLFSTARGQMFGILYCLNLKGERIVLKAFSGQYNSRWLIPGWVPPVIDPENFDNIVRDKDREIKKLDNDIAELNKDSDDKSKQIKSLKDIRKKISQDLMKEIHSLYYLNNFEGERKRMSSIFSGSGEFNRGIGMPAGTGDCCAPKLLNYAALESLIPLGLIEFYYGKENKSGTKKHKHYYPPCEDKCEPIMDFLLTGIDELHKKYKKLIKSVWY